MNTCPHCRQPIASVRLGVRLSPLKAAIVDRIKQAGDSGLSSVEIITDLYRDRRLVKSTVIKSHVNQINDLFCATDWRIVSDRRRWFLHRRRL